MRIHIVGGASRMCHCKYWQNGTVKYEVVCSSVRRSVLREGCCCMLVVQDFIAVPSHAIYAIMPVPQCGLNAIQGTFIVPAYLTLVCNARVE